MEIYKRSCEEHSLKDGFDVLIEGIAILPELLKQVNYEYNAALLGNQSSGHYDTILKSARKNESDWMHSLDDETIEAFATFNRAFSSYIAEEASTHGMRYIEIGDDSFEDDIQDALKQLLNN